MTGFLFIADRLKDMIISGGENIYSREVEDALMSHPAVHEASVTGVPDPEWGESVKAWIVLRAGEQAEARELIEHCRTLIASYKKPRFIAVHPDPAAAVQRQGGQEGAAAARGGVTSLRYSSELVLASGLPA